MARAKQQAERRTFVAGLITEANPLTFPENASTDESNFVLNRDGSRQRRLGMAYENSFSVLNTGDAPLTFDDYNISTYLWNNVDNNPALAFGVIQVGRKLWFVDAQSTALSGNVKNSGTFLLLDTGLGYSISGNARMEFASINGKLVIVSKELALPLKLSYDSVGDSFLVEEIGIKVRDIWGIDDGITDVSFRPPKKEFTLGVYELGVGTRHVYNIFNQGWPEGFVDVAPSGTGNPAKHLSVTKDVWPSNSDIWYVAKDGVELFNSTIMARSSFGNTPAPRGHFIIDPFARGASRVENTTDEGILGPYSTLDIADVVEAIPTDIELGRLSTVTTYASRVFYSGVDSRITDPDVRSPRYSGTIFFTQIIENDEQFAKCYQDADPTAEDVSALVATDGGTIKIPEAGSVLQLIASGNSLVVICDNGVWEISGADGIFRADDFSISKITNVGCISKGSVVNAEGNIIYWGFGGIYALSPNPTTGKLAASNFTETTIQTFYNNINSVGRANAVGIFDQASRKMSWLYNDTEEYDGVSLRKKYNKELIYDVVLKAFYINDIKETVSDSPFVMGYMPTSSFNVINNIQAVVVEGEQVQVNGEDVIVTESVRTRGQSQTKYLTGVPNAFGDDYGFTFSLYRDPDFKDWGEVDANAYMVTGTELADDTQRRKQINYLTVHFRRTETGFEDTGGGNLEATGASSATMRVLWDFADSSASGKWGRPFQAYRLKRAYFPTGAGDTFDYGWSVISTKNRLRGSGKAFSLRVDTEVGKDLYLLGWAMDIEGVTVV